MALADLNLRPILHASLRLGEGSGAILAFSLIENAWKLFCEMATFDSAEVSQSKVGGD